MEKRNPNNTQVNFAFLFLTLFVLLCSTCAPLQKNYDARVMEAYEIRMNGDADSAKVLLDLILAEDSTVAMAWYELSRTEQHMGLGDMQNMMQHHEMAQKNIEKALEFDPDNTAYLYFSGQLQSFGLYAALQMGNIWWRYKLLKVGNSSNNPLEGTWKVPPEAGSFGVGPMQGDISWWSMDETQVLDRPCFFDDSYIFGADGSFSNVLGTETWIEEWQGGSNACGTPVAPHDGTTEAKYTYNESAGMLTLNGKGAYLGIPKAYNGGELANPDDAPASITYMIEFSENNTVMTVDINAGGGKIRDILAEVEDTYLKLLALDPEFHVAKLGLVELFSFVPGDMGGNLDIAEKYATELEAGDLVCGAKAREIMMSPDADYISFWSDLSDKNEMNADLIEALGRSYLWGNNPEQADIKFNKAIEVDANKNFLYLEMGRYYMMMAMQGQMQIDSAVPLIITEFEKYLASQPQPYHPMKAWTKGQLAMLNFRTGKEAEGNKLMEEAKTLDPYFSRAFGTPSQALFIPPDSISQAYSYLSRPF